MGGVRGGRGDQPGEASEAGETVPQDSQAVQGEPELQLNVRHHSRY